MKLTDLQNLLTYYSAEKTYLNGQYYRIKELANQQYELARIMSDPCGGSLYNPRIVFQMDGEQLEPVLYENSYGTPILRFNQVDDSERLTQEADELFQDFIFQTKKVN